MGAQQLQALRTELNESAAEAEAHLELNNEILRKEGRQAGEAALRGRVEEYAGAVFLD